jgi:hypothetical protein
MPLAGLEPSLIQAGQITKDIAVIEQSRWKNIAEIALGDPDKFNSRKEMYFQGNDTEFENMVRKTVDIITESAKHSIKFVDEPISNISQLMRKALEIASQAGSEAESATISLIKKIASWQKSFLTIVPEILDNLPEQLVKPSKTILDYYKNAWDDTAGLLKFSGSAGKYALKLTGAAVGALLAGLDGVAEYKKAGGFTAEFFEWAAKAAATALIAIPVVGSLASFAMATSPIWGTAGVVAFVAAGTYFSIRLVAENLADAFKDEPNSFIYKASSGVLEAMKYLEGAAGTVLEQAASFFVSSAQAKEVSPGLDKIKVDTVHISGAGAAAHSDNKDNAWLFGSHDGVIIGGEADDWLIHTGYGEALGDKGDDVLLGLFSQILKKGEKIGDPPPKETPDTRKTAEDDLSLTLDGGEGNDWVISIGGEGAKTIGGLGRDWIYNRTNGGEIYGDSESGIYEKPVIGADGQPVLNADGTPKTIPTQVEDSEENSDNIWYAPNTVVKDAQHHDVLKFYGLTLTGGDANGGIAGFALFGGVGAGIGLGNFYNSLDKSGKYDWARSIYFDHLFPWMTYAFRPNKEFGGMDMYITNQFDLLFNAVFGGEPNEAYKKQLELDAKGIRNGFMKIEHADVVGSPWGAQHGELAEQGTFNMVFRSVNILSIMGPILSAFGAIGGLVAAMGMADGVLSLAAAAERFLQGAKWSSGADPLVIDLDGDGIETKELALSQVYFDIDNDLFGERTGWLSGDDGFLVRDSNRNGRIDNITEMFGGPGRSGFGDLRALDSNGDGKITRADLLWAELKVWQDKNSDGLTDAGEVKTLDQLGIVTLDLGATAINITTSQGARLTAFGDATFADGRTRRVYDAVLSANDSDTRYVGEAGRAAWQGTGQGASLDLKGFGRIANLSIAMANDLEFAALAPRVATAMTTPDLRVLTAQVGEVLGAWGFTLEQTRELTPVLVGADATGALRLLDRGVYVEDAQGGYWTLASGAPIRDARGQTITRASLEQVLAQAVSQGATVQGATWRLEQFWSPSSRDAALTKREPAPYLARLVNGRAVIVDYGVKQVDGSWRLASGGPSYASAAALMATAAPTGTEWRLEELGFNPYAHLSVDKIGVRFTDGTAVDYTVQVTDRDGSFYVWARNLDRALQLEWKTGDSRGFNLRNYAVDFDKLDEVNSTDNSTYRVEMLSPAQFHFAVSLGVSISGRRF